MEKITKLPRLQFISSQDAVESCKKALDAGVKWLQFRCKMAENTQELLDKAWKIRCMCETYGAMLTVNDFVFLAQEVRAHALHLGKEDMALREAREIVGADMIIGATAHSIQEAVEAAKNGADYIGLGAFRSSSTKNVDEFVLGGEGLEKIATELKNKKLHTPVFAIGGIEERDIEAIAKTGVYGIAMSAAILQSAEPKAIVRRVKEVFGE